MIASDSDNKVFYFADIPVGDELITVRVENHFPVGGERLRFRHPRTGDPVVVLTLGAPPIVWDNAPAEPYHRKFVVAEVVVAT